MTYPKITFPGADPLGSILSGTATSAAPAGAAPSVNDAERLAQVMGGNLAGSLTGGDKLMALSALLRSVSRGSQTSPQQVMAQLQQQKAAEIQGRMQIEQYRNAAAENARVNAGWTQLINETTDPERKRYLMTLRAEGRDEVLKDWLKYRDPGEIKAPTMRTRSQGGTEIQEEWNPETRTWTEVGRGPRWNPKGPGGVTVNVGPQGPPVVALPNGAIAVRNQ